MDISGNAWNLIFVVAGALVSAGAVWVNSAISYRRQKKARNKDRLLAAYQDWIAAFEASLENLRSSIVETVGVVAGLKSASHLDLQLKEAKSTMRDLRTAGAKLLLLEKDRKLATRLADMDERLLAPIITDAKSDDLQQINATEKRRGKLRDELRQLVSKLAQSDHFS